MNSYLRKNRYCQSAYLTGIFIVFLGLHGRELRHKSIMLAFLKNRLLHLCLLMSVVASSRFSTTLTEPRVSDNFSSRKVIF